MTTADKRDEAAATDPLEVALRSEARQLRSLPAPHMVPRVLESIRALKQVTPVAPTSRWRRVAGHALTRFALATAVVVGLIVSIAPSADDQLPATKILAAPVVQEAPLTEVASWLQSARSPLISRQLEQPLIDELNQLGGDVERAASAVIEPLIRSLLQWQLSPSLHAGGDQFDR